MAHDQLAVQFGEVYGRSPEMTLREHFAGLAMQGLVAAYQLEQHEVARKAVILADALIAELAKPGARDAEAHGAETRG